jgi:hypothetical protein
MEEELQGKGAPSNMKDGGGSQVLLNTPIKGIVKNNIDSTRTGRIQVFINKFKGTNPDDKNSWVTVNYLSPFFGYTPNTGSKDSNGTYSGNPNSYGFWATPPDIGTEVLCVFENGDPNFGYYIGSIPKAGLNHMVPAIGSTDKIIANGSEAKSYGGATRLPVAEFNNANDKQSGSPDLSNQPRPIHSYQAAILNKQGLLRDPDRGTIGSSSTRETPSRVFGMSTPGRPIYGGGYDDSSINDAVKDTSAPDSNFKVTGRLGGHSFVMDDGDLQGRDQLLRLRTSSGHMVMMNDSAGTLFIIHANGQSYIELGKEGTIDMYSTNSVNIRTMGDLNLHADNNININAVKDLNIRAENMRFESTKETSQLVGTDLKQHVKGNHSDKVGGQYAVKSGGNAGMTAGGDAFLSGGKVNLNTGAMSLTPADVSPLKEIKHSDTLNDSAKGYASAPGKLASITSRAPAHSPWDGAGKGVDVKVNLDAAANFPAPPAPAVAAANSSAPPAPDNTTSPALAATVPAAPAASPTLDKANTTTLVSQMSVNAATGPAADAVKEGAKVVQTDAGPTAAVGKLGMTPQQMEEAGNLKPGAGAAVSAAIASGKSMEQALTPNLFTGKDGVNNTSDFVKSTTAQVGAASSLLAKGESMLKQTGLLSGKESPTQSGGLIMAAATSGIKATMDFVKGATPSNFSLPSLPSGLGLNSLKIPNPLGGDIGKQISSGNFATGLADKALSGLSGLGDKLKDGLTSMKDSAAAAFDSVTAKFKDFKAGEPVSLTAEKVKNEAADAASGGGLLDTVKKAASDFNPMTALNKATSGLGGIIPNDVKGALDSAKGLMSSASKLGDSASSLMSKGSSMLSSATSGSPADGLSNSLKGGKMDVPGLDSIGSSIKNLVNSTSNSSINGALGMAKSALGGNSLAGKALSLLGPDPAAKLKGAIGSLGTGGGLGIKLPTIAEGGFDAGSIAAKSKELLGDPKIPALKFGDSAPPMDSSEMLARSRARTAASDKALKLQEAYEEARDRTGSRISPEAKAAYAEWQQAIADMDKLA